MNTHTVILIATLAFSVGCSATALLRQFVLHVSQSHKTISDDLTGPWSYLEDSGFIALAVGLVWLGIASAQPVTWLCWLVAAGILGALVTDKWHVGGKHWHRIHLVSAGVAFVGALALEAALASGALLWALFAAYPASVGGVYLMWPKYTAWQEKTAAAAIVMFLICWGIR